MRDLLRHQTGATFIELVAAVSVFAVATVGLSPALLNARKAANLSKDQSIATTLAADTIEKIRGTGIGSCANASNLNADGSSGGFFNLTCTQSSNTPITGVTRVAVAVSWREGQSTTNSVTLVTLVRQ